MKVLVDKKGMALFVVMAVVLFLMTLSFSMVRKVQDTGRQEKIIRENERADFMARGAIQLAMLKLSKYPYEFVDAITWRRGNIYSADWRTGIPGISKSYDGATVKQPLYYNYFVGVDWNDTTDKVITSYNKDPNTPSNLNYNLQWNISKATGDPFDGSGMVLFINLISKQDPNSKKWINSVEIGARGDETSELGMVNDISKMNVKKIIEIYRFNRVHVEEK